MNFFYEVNFFWLKNKNIYIAFLFIIFYSMKTLQPNIFQAWISMQNHIDNLSNPEKEISELEIVNLVVKFATHYILMWIWDHIPETKLTEKQADNILSEATLSLAFDFKRIIHSLLFSNITLVKEIDDFSKLVWYQLKMLLDFPKTVALMQEIIQQKIPRFCHTYHGLDMWTGSGILLLAQHIQARRNWFQEDRIKNIWIELNTPAATVWNNFAKKVGFWEIIQWDTCKKNTIQSLQLPYINYVSNENLPYPKVGLFSEPFVENIQNLKQSGFPITEIDWLFPQVVYYWIYRSESLKKLDLKDTSSWNNFLDDYEEFEKQIKVPAIQIWGTKTPLSEIGKAFESPFFTKQFLSTLWKRW